MITMTNSQPDVTLATILITEELSRRPAREPELAAENAAFQKLVRLMATQPTELLPVLLQCAVDLCHADTAGLSLPSRNELGDDIFRWEEMAGAFVAYHGGTTPRNFSQCGVTLDFNTPQLFDRPGRLFTYFNQLPVPVVEGLVVPLRSRDSALGTIWIITHHEHRHFDAEDARVMTRLADFTGAALQILQTARENACLYQEAREALRLRDEFVSTLCHDLRNPLTSIKGQANLLLRWFGRSEPPSIESVNVGLKSIAHAAERMDQQIGELADLAQLNIGHSLFLHPRSMDLVAFTGAISKSIKRVASIILSGFDCTEAELRGAWDPVRLARCLDNLLSNAGKFSPNGGAVMVKSFATPPGRSSASRTMAWESQLLIKYAYSSGSSEHATSRSVSTDRNLACVACATSSRRTVER